jgi:hypothetical protein
MPIGDEPFGDIRSDKTGPTSNKNAHTHLNLLEKTTLIADWMACDQNGPTEECSFFGFQFSASVMG